MPLAPAKKTRFALMSSVERVDAHLKDNHGGSLIRVRDACRVMAHLMFGIIVVTANLLSVLLC